MNSQYHYNLTGAERKALVGAISTILEIPAVYQKAPTFAYTIGIYTVDKTGALLFPDNTDPEELHRLLIKLQEQGYQPNEPIEPHLQQTIEELPEILSPQVAEDSNALTIKLPKGDMTDAALNNLKKLIESKGTLLKQAIGTECLEIRKLEDTLCFPWFTLHGIDGEAKAYSQLVVALVQMAKRQKRITSKEKPIENAKFSMRLFLVRLGFIGDEYKVARKILLRNLSGNSAWKSRQPPENRAEADTAEAIDSIIPTVEATLEAEDTYGKGGEAYER